MPHVLIVSVLFQLENGYTFHDYNIKLNDVIQLMVRVQASPEKETTEAKASEADKKHENKEEEYQGTVLTLGRELLY